MRIHPPKPGKPVSEMNYKEALRWKEKFDAYVVKQTAQKAKILEFAKEHDPFLAYVPTDGNVTEDRWQFLRKYLKEEDIPQRLVSATEVHKSTADIRLISGGNRGSKSTTAAIEDLIFATNEIPDSMKSWYPRSKLSDKPMKKIRVIGVDETQLNNTVIPTYKQWVPRSYLKKGSWDDSWAAKANLLTLYRQRKPVATIEFMTNQMAVEKFQGPPLDKLSIDEECIRPIWNENLMRFGTSDKLNIQMSWTPTKGLTWAYDLVTDTSKDTELFKMASVVNPYVNLDVLAQILDQFKDDYDIIKMRLLGEFVSLSGLIYGSLFDPGIHVIEPFKINYGDYIVYRGLDPHYAKPTTCVEMAVDKAGQMFIVGTYQRAADTQEVKDDLAYRAKSNDYRLGWTACDKSANATVRLLSDRNAFLELQQGKNRIPGLMLSEKFTGSIHAGVDEIKQSLKINPLTKRPMLMIFDNEENLPLIKAFRTMEREAYNNEDIKGLKDRIQEGPHDAHAAMRYIFQRRINWMPPVEKVPEYVPDNVLVGY